MINSTFLACVQERDIDPNATQTTNFDKHIVKKPKSKLVLNPDFSYSLYFFATHTTHLKPSTSAREVLPFTCPPTPRGEDDS